MIIKSVFGIWPREDRLLCNMSKRPVPSTPPNDQFATDALPPYLDFVANPTVEHRARAAARALADFAEHVFVYYEHHDQSVLAATKKPEDFVSHLAATWHCGELNIIWDFALAGKHRFLTRPASRPREIITSTGAIVPDSPAPLRLQLEDGRQPLMTDVLEAGISFWRRWLQQP